MEYANAKDITRAKSLGIHSGAKNLSTRDIARGKASSMATAITDRKKILGRLEAVATEWNDYQILTPFIERCLILWPGSQYAEAYRMGQLIGQYLKTIRIKSSIDKNYLLDMGKIKERQGKFIFTNKPYNFDSVAIIIFNTMYNRAIAW
jgi:hypothetical protein